jgi:hypothetical protein
LTKTSSDIENILDDAEKDLVAATMCFWQAHAGLDISPEDAREMVEGLSGVFTLLDAWDRNERKQPGA